MALPLKHRLYGLIVRLSLLGLYPSFHAGAKAGHCPTDWITHLLAVFGNVFKNVICIPSQPPSPFGK